MAIALQDRDHRNIDHRNNKEEEAGARVRAEIKDPAEISRNTSSLGPSHSDIEGNSHQLEEPGTTGRITIRITRTKEKTIGIISHIEQQKNSKIREEAQKTTKVPNTRIKMMDIADHVLEEIASPRIIMVLKV